MNCIQLAWPLFKILFSLKTNKAEGYTSFVFNFEAGLYQLKCFKTFFAIETFEDDSCFLVDSYAHVDKTNFLSRDSGVIYSRCLLAQLLLFSESSIFMDPQLGTWLATRL